MGRKIAFVGVSGNGKTTLARRLASKLDLTYTELDALNHKPGWVEATNDELRRDVEAVMNSSDGWVLDGSYNSKLGDLVVARADTIVWLDQSLPLVLKRLVARAVKDIVTKRDMFNGNRQTWRFAFCGKDSLVSFAIRMHFQRRRDWPLLWERYPNLEIVRLRSPREVERWFASLTPGSAG